tara:strand:+ start:1717 stop:2001 length:285 start_codon:yes stop_codon:yes gene_type:complete
MKLVWTDTALYDLKAVREYIAEHEPRAANRVAARLYEVTQKLKEFPGAGRAGRVPNTRELVVSGLPFIIPYTVDERCVQILAVIHTSRKWPEVF